MKKILVPHDAVQNAIDTLKAAVETARSGEVATKTAKMSADMAAVAAKIDA